MSRFDDYREHWKNNPLALKEIEMIEKASIGTASSEVNVLYENEKNWANICDQYMIQPFRGGDGRVLILEDAFQSRLHCSRCKGKGHIGEVCKECNGNGRFRGKPDSDDHCTTCYIVTDKTQSGNKGAIINLNGKQPCNLCDGKGFASIVIPDDQQKNSTMGNVLAVSTEGIVKLKPGDKVIFTTYTGSPFKLLEQDLRIALERDILGIVKQLKSNVEGLTEGSFVDLDNTGTPHV